MPETLSRLVDELHEEEDRVFESAPHFPRPEIFRFMGGGNGRLGSRQTIKKVHNWTKRLGSIVKPRIVYSLHPVADVTKTRIQLQNGTVFNSVKMAGALCGSHQVVCFVATLGQDIDDVIETLTQGNNLSEGFVVDTIGSVGTEQLVERFHKIMEGALRRNGKGVTLRFSPGYCDWPITEQHKLFRLVRPGRIGVRLTESSLMVPRKSVSGIFGVTRNASGKLERHNPCTSCGKKNCIARRPT